MNHKERINSLGDTYLKVKFLGKWYELRKTDAKTFCIDLKQPLN
jgi:hypothetical protein